MAKLVTPTWAPNTSKPPYSICCLRSNDGHSHERVQGAVEFPLPSQSRSEGNGVMDAETSSGTYTPFASSQTSDPIIESLEGEAREPKKGLWADPHPVPPWEWRKQR